MKRAAFILKVFVFFVAVFSGFIYWQFYVPAQDSGAQVFFEIKEGEHFGEILPRLKEKHLIRNAFVFKVFARISGMDTQIKAGAQQFDSSFTPVKILRSLAYPDNAQIAVTIPEGYSVYDIDRKLTALDMIEKGDFIKWMNGAGSDPGVRKAAPFLPITDSLEGYLFPDTYFIFSKNFRPRDLGILMLRTFKKKALPLLDDEIKKAKGPARSMDDIVKMASILEKEVRTESEMRIAAGILWKRLDNGWPLQDDATLLYGKKDAIISRADLAEDGPYNTYTRQGLPKTPIGNPGLKAIQASLEPTETPYWFYITTPEGKAIYGKTNEEHERNKREFLYN